MNFGQALEKVKELAIKLSKQRKKSAKKLEKMINTLWEQVQRFRITYVSDSNASLSLIDEHQSILNAIKEGNIADSKKFAIKHIEKAEQFMLEHCTK